MIRTPPGTAGIADLLVGSDEKKALAKAIQQCFPQSTLVLYVVGIWKKM